MRNLLKRSATLLVIGALALPMAMPASAASRVVVVDKAHAPAARVVVKDKHHHRFKVGHKLKGQNVVVIKDWKARGLPSPGRGEVYVVDGDDIYLAAAATMVIKALID